MGERHDDVEAGVVDATHDDDDDDDGDDDDGDDGAGGGPTAREAAALVHDEATAAATDGPSSPTRGSSPCGTSAWRAIVVGVGVLLLLLPLPLYLWVSAAAPGVGAGGGVAAAATAATTSADPMDAFVDPEAVLWSTPAWHPFPDDAPDLLWHLPLRDAVLPDPPSLPPLPAGKQRARLAIVSFMFGAAATERHADAHASMACYAAHHGYPYYVEPLDLVARHPLLTALPNRLASDFEKVHFNKVLVLQKYLPHFDWVLMVDGDVFPLNRTAPLEPFLDDRFVVITQRRPGGEMWPNAFWRNDPKAFMLLQLWMSYLTSGWAGNGDNGPYIDMLLQVALPREYTAAGGCHELWRNVSRAFHSRHASEKWQLYGTWVDCYDRLLNRRYEHAPFWKLHATMMGFMRAAEMRDPNMPCHSTWQPGDVLGHGKGFKRFIKTHPHVLCDHNEPHADERVMTVTRAEWDTFRAQCRHERVMHPDDFDVRFARYYPPHPDAASVPLVRVPQKRKPPTPADDDTA